MPTVLTVMAMSAASAMFAVTVMPAVLSALTMTTVFAMASTFLVMAVLAVTLSLGDHTGTGEFLAPLTTGGAQVTMFAAAGTYICFFFHVY